MITAGLILAAGESRRMGAPKALLPYAGATFLESIVALFAPRCSPIIVVLGAEAEEIQRNLAAADGRAGTSAGFGTPPELGGRQNCLPHDGSGLKPRIVINFDYKRGQLSSMQCGLRAVPPEADGVLFTLVDHPAVSESTVEALLDAADRRPVIRVPRYQGRRGHPIWFSRMLISEFLAEPAYGAARDVVRRHEAETEFLDVDDPGVITDIDDPAAYRSLVGGAL